MSELDGKVAVVTGASRGIGASAALELANAGASVVLAARTVSQCEALVVQIHANGGKAIAVACDVSDYQQTERAIQAGIDAFGSLDILINNAGVIEPIGQLVDSDPVAWTKAADINYKGVYNGLRVALPLMQASGSGTIVNLSSGAAHRGLEGWSHYCSAKAAAAMLTECAHIECGANGVRILGLSPGTVATEMQVLIKASGINQISQLDPSVHSDPKWPALAIVWLCTDASNAYLGREATLRDDEVRQAIGMSA